MAKKGVKKARVSKNTERLNAILVENFISLQKALTNLTVKFDNLSNQISSLLQLFEISARSFTEKLSREVPEIEKDKEFLGKLNALLEQNKVIAKGLTLMEEKIRGRLYGQESIIPQTQPVYQRFQQSMPKTIPRPGYFPSETEREKGKTRETE